MHSLESCILQISENIRADVHGFRNTVERYIAGELDETRFRAIRVPMGIYEQRNGGYMVRLRPGAGVMLPAQARALANAARSFGPLHVTTRQGMQIHDVPIKDAPDLLESLLKVNLTARGGGGNTVRNICVSPRSGADPDEIFDVRPYAISLTEYLLQFSGSFNLPRKFKIAFVNGPADDAFASIADAGLFARMRNGMPGWRVYGGGGMGAQPRPGVLLEEWVPVDQVFAVAESLRSLFDRYGDRANRHAARLRFVLKRLGEDGFIKAYMDERRRLDREGLPGAVPVIRTFPSVFRDDLRAEARELGGGALSAAVLHERERGFYSLRINPLFGLLQPDALIEIATLAEGNSDGLLRATQQQELVMCGVPGGRVESILDKLREMGTDVFQETRPSVVACAGAATCKLGLCLSRGLAREIISRFPETRGQINLPPMRISGCPNSCGNHQAAELGFAGKARRVAGRLMPCYDIIIGGRASDDGGRLGERVGSVPARRIPDLLAAALKAGAFSEPTLRALAEEFATLPNPIPEDFFYDWDSAIPFSLAGRGPGECGAGTMDIIRVDVETARNEALRARGAEIANDRDAALYEALLAITRALLPVYGLEPGSTRKVFSEFSTRLIDQGWVHADTRKILDAAMDWKTGDSSDLQDIAPGIEALIERVEELFQSLDSNLNFRVPRIRQPETEPEQTTPAVTEKDLRGVACPLNFVKAKVVLETLPVGAILEVLLDEGDPVKNVPASFREQGQEVLSVDREKSYYRVRIHKKK